MFLRLFFVLFLFSGTAFAYPIDDFGSPQNISCSSAACIQYMSAENLTSFKGKRRSVLWLNSGNANSLNISSDTYSNTLEYSSTNSSNGVFRVVWDGTIENTRFINNSNSLILDPVDNGTFLNLSGMTGIRILTGTVNLKSSTGNPAIGITIFTTFNSAGVGERMVNGYSGTLSLLPGSNTKEYFLDINQFNFPAGADRNTYLSKVVAFRMNIIGNYFNNLVIKCIETTGGSTGTDFCVNNEPSPTPTYTPTHTPNPPGSTEITPVPYPTSTPNVNNPAPGTPDSNSPTSGTDPDSPVPQPTADSSGCRAVVIQTDRKLLSKSSLKISAILTKAIKDVSNRVKNNSDRYSTGYLDKARKFQSSADTIKTTFNEKILELPVYLNDCPSALFCRINDLTNEKRGIKANAKKAGKLIRQINSLRNQVNYVFPNSSLSLSRSNSYLKQIKKEVNKINKITKKLPNNTRSC